MERDYSTMDIGSLLSMIALKKGEVEKETELKGEPSIATYAELVELYEALLDAMAEGRC